MFRLAITLLTRSKGGNVGSQSDEYSIGYTNKLGLLGHGTQSASALRYTTPALHDTKRGRYFVPAVF